MPALVLAVMDWIAVARASRTAEYFFKPATMSALIAVASVLAADAPVHHYRFVLVALSFSLLGDVFLMLPRNLFVQGLVSFLVAHIAYVFAFAPFSSVKAVAIFVLLLVSASFTLYRRYYVESLKDDHYLAVAVYAYVVVITAMVSVVTGTLFRDGDPIPLPSALAGAVGACLFFVSDALIGWSRFVVGRASGRSGAQSRSRSMAVAIMVSYHLGQTGLVLSLVR